MSSESSKPLVLFLCTGNSARSRMAQAILRAKAGDEFEAASAGLHPIDVNPLTLRVLEDRDLPTRGLRSKPTTEFLGKAAVRYAVVMCERVNESCPRLFPFAGHILYWPFEDPAQFSGTPEQKSAKFREVRDLIETRIDQWLDDWERSP